MGKPKLDPILDGGPITERYELLIRKANGRRRTVKVWRDKGESYRDYLKAGEAVIAWGVYQDPLGIGYVRGCIQEPDGKGEWR